MIIRGIEVYRINELSAKAQREVFYREICDGFYYKWWDYIEDDLRSYVESNGCSYGRLRFSGFSYQGDGANVTLEMRLTPEFFKSMPVADTGNPFAGKVPPFWTSSDSEAEIIKECFSRDLVDEIQLFVNQDRGARYQHKHTLSAGYEIFSTGDDNPFWTRFERAVEAVADALLEWTKDLSQCAYRMLEQEWYDITSDEALTEMLLEAGPNGDGYVFARDGKYIGHLLIDADEEKE
jgi:hypothetical protein